MDLTPEQITAILAGTRKRGGHADNIRKFVSEGELYTVVSELPEYRTKDATVLKNTLTQVAKREQIKNVRFVKHEDGVLMINTELLGANAEVDSDEG